MQHPDTIPSPDELAADAVLIGLLGGTAKVATIMGLPNPGGQRRVDNWTRRGIPPAVKLKYPGVFLGAKALEAAQIVAKAKTEAPPSPPLETAVTR